MQANATVDTKGRPLSFMLTGGQVHDSQVVEEILTADKAYDSERVRQQIRDEGALPIIPSRRSQALLQATAQNREFLLAHQGLATYRYPLR